MENLNAVTFLLRNILPKLKKIFHYLENTCLFKICVRDVFGIILT